MVQTYQRLGELLLHRGAINSLQLSIALADQRISNRRLGEILTERNFATEIEVAQCLAQQYGYPLEDLLDFVPKRQALTYLKAENACSLRALPLDVTEDGLLVAISDPIDVLSTDRLAALVRMRLQVRIAPESILMRTIRSVYGLEEPLSPHFEHAANAPSRFKALKLRSVSEGCSFVEAFDTQLDRTVNLVVCPEGSAQETEHFQMVLAAGRQPVEGVVPVFDSLLNSGFRWTVLQRVYGDPLDRIIKVRGPRPVPQAAEWVAKCAETVDQIQRSGAPCTWLCPSNVYVRQSGPVLVPASLPPARYKSPSAAFDSEHPSQVAVYAIGMLLKDSLCGLGNPLGGGIPAPMHDILANCLADDPSKRFGTAVEVASALKTYNWHALSNPLANNTSAERDQLLETLFAKGDERTPEASTVKKTLWQKLFGKRTQETQ